MRVGVVGGHTLARVVVDELREREHEVPLVWSEDDRLEAGTELAGPAAPWKIQRLVEADLGVLLSVHNSDVFVTREMREATQWGALGYHPSLLPRHRGRDSVRWTIHMRDPIAGGTVYWLDDGADTGPVALQDWCWVKPDDDASSLWRRELFPMGVRLLLEAVDLLADRKGLGPLQLPAIPQDEAVATWEPAFEGEPLVEALS